jgi:hypothetical protein
MSGQPYDPMEEALRLAEQCYPILVGEPAVIQGAALCELVARHVAGHVILNDREATAKLRIGILAAFIEAVENLIPVTDEQVIQPEIRRRGDAPGYWKNETSGALRPAVEAYLNGEPLNDEQIAVIRHYLAQWIYARGFDGGGEGVGRLRDTLGGLKSRRAIKRWLDDALEAGIDPL